MPPERPTEQEQKQQEYIEKLREFIGPVGTINETTAQILLAKLDHLYRLSSRLTKEGESSENVFHEVRLEISAIRSNSKKRNGVIGEWLTRGRGKEFRGLLDSGKTPEEAMNEMIAAVINEPQKEGPDSV